MRLIFMNKSICLCYFIHLIRYFVVIMMSKDEFCLMYNENAPCRTSREMTGRKLHLTTLTLTLLDFDNLDL